MQLPLLPQSWKKFGLIIKPDPSFAWMKTHAMVPVARNLVGDIFRIYFSGRDSVNRSLIGYADIDINRPDQVIRFSQSPVLGLGALGCFDDNGVTPSWLVEDGNKLYLYYIGWNRGSTVRMHLVAGLAASVDGGNTFERVLRVPILDRTEDEPYHLNTGPCVIREADKWRMWYVSGVEWINADLPKYNIKYAESTDGIHWKRDGHVCIDFASANEHALARPCVIKEDGIYKMWFSHKGDAYRIGYAESFDGLEWVRKDALVNLDVSSSDWDSEMIEYAYVFTHKQKKYMLYCGNNYGAEGIGLAVHT